MQLQSVKSGLKNCIIATLPKEELRDFQPKQGIRNDNFDDKNKKTKKTSNDPHDNFMEYAKQRELINNIDKKLDYHNL